MRTQSATLKNPAPAMTPPIICDHPDDVAEVQPEANLRLRVRFIDGTSGIVDMSCLVRSSRAGVFAALADPEVFSQAGVELGAVTWPGGIDLAPDAMYSALKQDGIWNPE